MEAGTESNGEVKGLIGLLHAAQPGPSDAGFTRLVYWFTSSTRLRACKRCLSARLWRNEQIGRFLGTRLRWCKRERMGKRADTENHFCVRHASNQTASQLDLYSCIRKPIKRLWYLTSLAPAGLHAACEPGCAHPQTNQPLSDRRLLHAKALLVTSIAKLIRWPINLNRL